MQSVNKNLNFPLYKGGIFLYNKKDGSQIKFKVYVYVCGGDSLWTLKRLTKAGLKTPD